MIDVNPVDANTWVAYLVKYGVPTTVAVALYYVAPKVWGFISQRLNISSQSNDLTQAGLSGVNEVFQMLRGQMTDMTGQLQAMQTKIKDMSDTLDKAVNDKMIAQHEAQQAKSDLFQLQLYVERLLAQIKSLGAKPVDK